MKILEGRRGIEHIELEGWKEFISFIDEIKEKDQYIWRGQSDSSWDLVSSFDRLAHHIASIKDLRSNLKKHIERFRYIARGRISYDDICDNDEDEIFALAQHYGLATPLLDWTYSPFVALFFAIHHYLNEIKKVSIWGLGNITSLNKKAKELGMQPIVRFNPQQKNNSRLISQNALFTIVPLGYAVNKWIEEIVEEDSDRLFLYKIDIQFSPEEIKDCLIFLNRMNINYYTLFPDAEGVTKFCDMAFKIPKYHRFW